MDRHERLRQLREQRQLVARHLAWLESQIETAETDAATRHPFSAGPGTPEPIVSRSAEAAASDATVTDIPGPVATSPDKAGTTSDSPLTDPATFAPRESAADQARKQKVGCIALTILATAIAVFVIWGLPLILYRD